MESISKQLNEFNSSFQLQNHQSQRMNTGVPNAIEELNNFQRYELALNQDYWYMNSYQDLENTIISWIDPQQFDLSGDELVSYIEERLKTSCSIDRVYFFYELILNFCNQKQKRSYAQIMLEALKEVILQKIQDDNELDLILKLLTRFIIVSEKYNLGDEKLILTLQQRFSEDMDIENDFHYFLHFFNYIFKRYDKKMYCHKHLIDCFNHYADLADEKILSKSYYPQTAYAAKLANLYDRINDYNRKIYFYQKEIDNTLAESKNIENNNVTIYQSIVKDNLSYANKISYKQKEIKLLLKKISDYIVEHYEEIFHRFTDEEYAQEARNFFEKTEQELIQKNSIEEKLDYIFFYLFHFTYNSTQYEAHNKEKKFSISDIFTPSRINLKGYAYIPKDKDLFSYFNIWAETYNNLFLYLDYKSDWINLSSEIIIENINDMKMFIDNKLQFTKAIQFFSEEKYLEFMYISPTLIEIILKQYLVQINGDIIGGREELVEKTLNQIILELIEDKNCYIDKIILRYIEYIMVDNAGMNIRNDILHGNYKDEYFHKTQAMYLYTILIYLIRYFANDQD